MNKTIIAVALICIFALGLIGGTLIIIFRPDASATFFSFVGSTLATAVGFGAVLLGISKQSDTLQRVEKQTNGINTALLSAIPSQTLTPAQIDSGKTADIPSPMVGVASADA